jgi:electron transfer flavoprotein alpha subunit
MTVLVLVEQDEGRVSDATLSAITAARVLGAVHALATDPRAAADAAAIDGVEAVLLAEDPAYRDQIAEPIADLIVSVMPGHAAFVAAATANGKNIAPRVAALLDVMQVSDVVAIDSADTFVRPIYAGNVLATVRSSDAQKVLTIRTTAFARAGRGGRAGIVPVTALHPDSDLSRLVGAETHVSDRPDLASAKVVVAGGRGLGSRAQFDALIAPLADKLGAAVGASRAAVDDGYVAGECQIGQTGRIIAPDIYLAIGISGAIQHVAGMKDATTIVAINRDRDAPIFQFADLGLVGDLFEIVPELTRKV